MEPTCSQGMTSNECSIVTIGLGGMLSSYEPLK